jgi:AcrR family transcriptional regulator
MADVREKYQEILRVATDLFLARGYREVTTRMVAEAAGISRQTLFNLYTDKAQLFRACLDFASPSYPESALDPAQEPAIVLRRFVKELVQWLSRENSLAFSRLLLIDGRNLPELADVAEENQNTHFIAPLAAYLAKWGLEQPRNDTNARIFIAMAIAQWNQAVSFGRALPDDAETERNADRVTAIFLNGAASRRTG